MLPSSRDHPCRPFIWPQYKILSSAATLDIGPGVKAQGLHCDDFIWQRTHTVPREKYSSGSDVGMGLLIPGANTTAEDGATLVKLSIQKF